MYSTARPCARTKLYCVQYYSTIFVSHVDLLYSTGQYIYTLSLARFYLLCLFSHRSSFLFLSICAYLMLFFLSLSSDLEAQALPEAYPVPRADCRCEQAGRGAWCAPPPGNCTRDSRSIPVLATRWRPPVAPRAAAAAAKGAASSPTCWPPRGTTRWWAAKGWPARFYAKFHQKSGARRGPL